MFICINEEFLSRWFREIMRVRMPFGISRRILISRINSRKLFFPCGLLGEYLNLRNKFGMMANWFTSVFIKQTTLSLLIYFPYNFQFSLILLFGNSGCLFVLNENVIKMSPFNIFQRHSRIFDCVLPTASCRQIL